MSPPLTGHRDDCSGAQRASWHPVLSLLSQSLSHPSLPFCLLLRQALMHAYIIGLGKAWGAGTGRVGEGGWSCLQNSQEIFRRKHSERITGSFLRYTRGFLQTYFIYCLLNWEICSKAPKVGLHAVRDWYQPDHHTIWWNVELFYIESVLIATRSHFCTDIFLHLLCICLQANEYSLPSLNTGLEDVKPSLSTSASSDLASSVSQSYSVVTGTIWLTLDWSLKE